jgi:phosphotransacetylase
VAANSPHIVFERVLAAVGKCLDRQSAEALIQVRADQMQERIEELADKSTEGMLTPEERDEYEALVRVGNFVAILQAKARRLLSEGHAATLLKMNAADRRRLRER